MNMNDVPSDVLICIIDSVSPKDLVNFVCPCRRIHEHARSRLILHRNLIRRYGIIELNPYVCEVMTPILDLLHAFNQPLSRPSNVKFNWNGIEEQIDVPRLPEKIEACNLEHLLHQCLWLPSGDRAEWMTAIRDADCGAAFAVLLNFLPDLRGLHLIGLEAYRSRLSHLLASRDGTPGAPLDSVRFLHVEHWDTEDGVRLEQIGDLVYPPGLRVLSGFMVKAYDEHEDHQARGQTSTDRTSLVITVRLLQSAISPSRLFEFLRPMNRLKKLGYEHGGAIVGGPPELNIDEYADEFEAVAQDWLEERALGLEIEGTSTIVLSRAAFER